MVSKVPSMPLYTSVSTTEASSPLASRFLLVSITAFGFTSPAVTSHPLAAQWTETTPDPHPTSRTFSPCLTFKDSMSRMLSSEGG
jgi:hypothetical protein